MQTRMLPRRGFLSVISFAAATVAAPALRAQIKLEKPRMVLAVDGKAAFSSLPLTIAEQLGYFKAEGLDVEFIDSPSSMRAHQALTSGAADVVAGSFESTLYWQSRGQFLRSFVLQGRAPQCALGLSTKALPGAGTAVDLRGKKIGVPTLGSASHLLVNAVLTKAGITPLEITYVAVGGGGSALNALRTGQIDALSHTESHQQFGKAMRLRRVPVVDERIRRLDNRPPRFDRASGRCERVPVGLNVIGEGVLFASLTGFRLLSTKNQAARRPKFGRPQPILSDRIRISRRHADAHREAEQSNQPEVVSS